MGGCVPAFCTRIKMEKKAKKPKKEMFSLGELLV
jgi:hypothetical protein